MSLVDLLGYGTITGRYVQSVLDDSDPGDEPDLVPIAGARIEITPSIRVSRWIDTNGESATVGFNVLRCETDAQGYIINPQTSKRGITLIATDDVHLTPPITHYNISVTAPSIPQQNYRIAVPADQVVDLTTAEPVPDNPVNAIAEWSRVRGEVIQARDEAVQAADDIPGLVAVAVDELAGPLIQATVETQVPPFVASEVASAVVPHVQAAEAAAGDAVDARDAINQLQITASASTLDAGESATAVMSGTTPEMTLTLGIPRGPQGVKGDQGDPGGDGFRPVLTHVWAGNDAVIMPTGIDLANSRFVAPGHGLTNGTIVRIVGYPLDSITNLPPVLPGGFTAANVAASFAVANVTTDAFGLAVSGVGVVFSENAAMDLTKVRIEKVPNTHVALANLGSFTSLRTRVLGKMSLRYIKPIPGTSGNYWVGTDIYGSLHLAGMAWTDVVVTNTISSETLTTRVRGVLVSHGASTPSVVDYQKISVFTSPYPGPLTGLTLIDGFIANGSTFTIEGVDA